MIFPTNNKRTLVTLPLISSIKRMRIASMGNRSTDYLSQIKMYLRDGKQKKQA